MHFNFSVCNSIAVHFIHRPTEYSNKTYCKQKNTIRKNP